MEELDLPDGWMKLPGSKDPQDSLFGTNVRPWGGKSAFFWVYIKNGHPLGAHALWTNSYDNRQEIYDKRPFVNSDRHFMIDCESVFGTTFYDILAEEYAKPTPDDWANLLEIEP